jgi:general secretion pathway protein N
MLVAALVTAVIMAPAAWIGDFLESRGPVRLVHVSGTIWRGSGFLAVSDGRRAHTVPGRLLWRVQLSELLSGRLTLMLQHQAAAEPIGISINGRAVEVAAGQARLPAALLAVLGAPFNTVRPGGTLSVQWDNMRFGDNGFEGNVQVDWEDAQSALSPVAPLGSFRLTASGRGALGEANLVTLRGPLLLQGQGSMDHGAIRFSGTADAQPEMRASLDGLIGLLGRRAGDRVLLDWEIRN